MNEEGEIDAISVTGSTRGLEDSDLGSAKKSMKKCSVSTSILV